MTFTKQFYNIYWLNIIMTGMNNTELIPCLYVCVHWRNADQFSKFLLLKLKLFL